MNEVCRLCRKSADDSFVSLFVHRNSQSVYEMVTQLFPELTIQLNDRLPQSICGNCCEITTSAFTLKGVGLESENYFFSELLQSKDVMLSIDIMLEGTDDGISTVNSSAIATSTGEIIDQGANLGLSEDDFKRNFSIIESTDFSWYSCNFCGTVSAAADEIMTHIESLHNPTEKISSMKEATGDASSDDDRIVNSDVMFSTRAPPPGAEGSETPLELEKLMEGVDSYITDDNTHDSSETCVKDKEFSCSKCESVFKNRRCLQDHVRRHHKETLRCQHCNTTFTDRSKLRQHILIEHNKDCRELSPENVKYVKKCCACLIEFKTDEQLLNHLTVHKDNIGKLLCDHKAAPKSFKDFIAHSKYHLQPKTHECLHCNKFFPFDGKFLVHLTGHKRTDVHRRISCPKCGSKFRNARELETHDKVKHRNENLFICSFCEKSFCSKSTCDSHIKFVHKNEKRFECKVCKMRFNLRAHLSRHESTHKKDRPCVCSLCGNSFKTKEGLGFHMKRHDGSMKKFACKQCSFTFVSKNRLQVHMLTHSGAKPFECEFCDRAYTSKGDLVKHLQKMHVGSAVYRCEKCPEAFPRIVELREHLLVHFET